MQAAYYRQYPIYSITNQNWILLTYDPNTAETSFQNEQGELLSPDLGVCLDFREEANYAYYCYFEGKIYRVPYSRTTSGLIKQVQEFIPENIVPANPWVGRMQKIALPFEQMQEEILWPQFNEDVLRTQKTKLTLIEFPETDLKKEIDLLDNDNSFENLSCLLADQEYCARIIAPYFGLLLNEIKKTVYDNPAAYICALKAILLGNLNAYTFAEFNFSELKNLEILAESWQLRFALIEDGINRLEAHPKLLINEVYDYLVAVISAEIIRYDLEEKMSNAETKQLNFLVRPAIMASACPIGSMQRQAAFEQLVQHNPNLSENEEALLYGLYAFVQRGSGFRRLKNLTLEQWLVYAKILGICFDDDRYQNYLSSEVDLAQRVIANFLALRRAAEYENSEWPLINFEPGFDHGYQVELKNLQAKLSSLLFGAIYLAIYNNDFALIQKILSTSESKLIINIDTEMVGDNLVFLAANRGDLRVVEILLNAGARFNPNHLNAINLLQLAIQRNNLELSFRLLALGINPNQTNSLGESSIYLAAEQGKLEILVCLLQVEYVDVNQADASDGLTPLHVAVFRGHLNIVQTLLAVRGIEVNKADNDGITPLHIAVDRGQENVVQVLLAAAGIDVNKPDNDGLTPLHIAVDRKNLVMIQILLAVEQLDINRRNNDGVTPFYMAAQSGSLSVMRELMLHADLDVNISSHKGVSPLHAASLNGQLHAIRYLLELSAINKNICTVDGANALHFAALHGNLQMVKMLFVGGVDSEKKDMRGETPYDLAVQNNHPEIAQTLQLLRLRKIYMHNALRQRRNHEDNNREKRLRFI